MAAAHSWNPSAANRAQNPTKFPKAKATLGVWPNRGGLRGEWKEERGGECEGLASSPLPHIFNELDIKKF